MLHLPMVDPWVSMMVIHDLDDSGYTPYITGIYIYMVYIYRDGMYIYILYIYAHAHKNIHKSDELTQLPTDCGRSYIAWTSSESKMQIWKHSGGL